MPRAVELFPSFATRLKYGVHVSGELSDQKTMALQLRGDGMRAEKIAEKVCMSKASVYRLPAD